MKCIISIASFLIATIAWCNDPPVAERTVHLTVQLQPQGGVIIPEHTPVAASAEGRQYISSTNAAGVAALECRLPATAKGVYIVLDRLSLPRPLGDTMELIQKRDAALRLCESTLAVPELRFVGISDTQDAYVVSIPIEAGVKVSGVFVNQVGKPQHLCPVYRDGFVPYSVLTSSAGAFAVERVPKGKATHLAIQQNHRDDAIVVPLSAAQLNTNVDIGTVSSNSASPHGVVKMSVENLVLVPPDPVWTRESLVMVRSDGLRMCALTVGADMRARPSLFETRDARIGTGEYFVCVGGLGGSPGASKMARMLRAGRSAELIAAGMMRIVVTENEIVTVSVDIKQQVDRLATVVE